MNLRLNPLYKSLLMLAIVLGPIIWLIFTEDGRRRTDLVMLSLFGKVELNLAIEELSSEMTEQQFSELFPSLELACSNGANPFGNRVCTAQIGAFDAIPSRTFTLFLNGDKLRAAKLNFFPAYYQTLRQQLTKRVGSPILRSDRGSDTEGTLLSWKVRDGVLLLPSEEPQSDIGAALMWLSEPVLQQPSRDGDAEPSGEPTSSSA